MSKRLKTLPKQQGDKKRGKREIKGVFIIDGRDDEEERRATCC